MDVVFKWVLANRPRAYGIAVVVIGWLGLTPIPDAIPTGLLTILGLLLGTEVHNSVMTTKRAAAAITEATQTTAQAVAKELDPELAGPRGVLEPQAAETVQHTASEVASEVLKDVGIVRKDLAA